MATLPLMLLLTVFPTGVVYTWSGNVELALETAPFLMPLALGSFLNAQMQMPCQSQLAHGWTSLMIRVNVVAVAIIIPAISWFVPRYGGRAAAWLWVGLNAAYVLITIHFMHQRILPEEKRRWYLQDLATPLAAAVLVGLVSRLWAPSLVAHRAVWGAFLAGIAMVTAITALVFADCLRPRIAVLLNHSSWKSS
jgi:hypothetical protein